MSVDVRVVRVREFLSATVTGEFDLSVGRAALNEIANIPPEGMNILIDARGITGKGTLPELYQLAREFQQLRKYQGRKTAILADSSHLEDAQFLSVMAKQMGVDVRAVSSFEDALEWFE